jgi:hypothetical protein
MYNNNTKQMGVQWKKIFPVNVTSKTLQFRACKVLKVNLIRYIKKSIITKMFSGGSRTSRETKNSINDFHQMVSDIVLEENRWHIFRIICEHYIWMSTNL